VTPGEASLALSSQRVRNYDRIPLCSYFASPRWTTRVKGTGRSSTTVCIFALARAFRKTRKCDCPTTPLLANALAGHFGQKWLGDIFSAGIEARVLFASGGLKPIERPLLPRTAEAQFATARNVHYTRKGGRHNEGPDAFRDAVVRPYTHPKSWQSARRATARCTPHHLSS